MGETIREESWEETMRHVVLEGDVEPHKFRVVDLRTMISGEVQIDVVYVVVCLPVRV